MLYDNAQLSRVYLHAWQVTGNDFFRTITEEILDYVMRQMLDPAGGFYSTQDADSEEGEGKFFVWAPDEIHDVLGNEADALMAAYGVTRHVNASTGSAHGFEGKNILEFVGDLDQDPALSETRRKLFEARKTRVHPGRDAKILTSWNGLMLAAITEVARALNRDDYCQVAERNADFLLRELRLENGCLLRTWKQGEATLNGYLEDYAYLIEGLLKLYQTTFEPRWFVAAQELAETMIEHYADSDGTFFDASDDHENWITLPRDLQDNATPSGTAVAISALLKVGGFSNDLRYVDIAHEALAQMQTPTGGAMLSQYPLGFVQWLQTLSYALTQPREIAIIGDPEAADTRALLNVARNGYPAFQVLALGAPDAHPPAVPLLQDRGLVEGHGSNQLFGGEPPRLLLDRPIL